MSRTSASNGNGERPTVTELRAQLETVQSDLRILTEMAGKKARTDAVALREDAGNRISELSEDAQEAFRAARDHVQERGAEAYGELEGAIRRNPLAAIGVAAAAGWLIGQLSRR